MSCVGHAAGKGVDVGVVSGRCRDRQCVPGAGGHRGPGLCLAPATYGRWSVPGRRKYGDEHSVPRDPRRRCCRRSHGNDNTKPCTVHIPEPRCCFTWGGLDCASDHRGLHGSHPSPYGPERTTTEPAFVRTHKTSSLPPHQKASALLSTPPPDHPRRTLPPGTRCKMMPVIHARTGGDRDSPTAPK